eukprot:COSAG05_NODE_7393_length_818_cov_1.322670_2_plen_133_part_01
MRLSEYGRYTVRVWAAPGDVLGVPQAYHLVAIYGGNGDVIDLCLKRSGTWEEHYALMEIKTQYDAGADASANGIDNDNSVFHHAGGSVNESNNGANGASGGEGGGSGGPTGYTAYRHEGWGAEHGEAEKNSSW